MTASVTGRKRCGCGQYKTPLANGTMPRHCAPMRKDKVLTDTRPYKRVHCEYTGKFPPADPRWSKNKNEPPKARGGHRARKREAGLKARYRRNAAGGYTR